MKARTFLMILALAALMAGIAAASPEEKKPAGAQQMSPEMQAAMDKMMKLATPGEHHKHLGALVGRWKAHVTYWMPGAPPQESEGTEENAWILGGRFVQTKVKGNFADMPFEGFGLMGYDNYKNRYQGVWGDSMGTMLMYSEGTIDAEGKVFTSSAEFDDPMSGSRKKMREVSTIADSDHRRMEMFETGPDGKEMKVMLIEYTRAK